MYRVLECVFVVFIAFLDFIPRPPLPSSFLVEFVKDRANPRVTPYHIGIKSTVDHEFPPNFSFIHLKIENPTKKSPNLPSDRSLDLVSFSWFWSIDLLLWESIYSPCCS